MRYIIHKENERGSMDIGWLKAKYSFSFANYYDPNKTGFGFLKVLNDDIIALSGGFDTHPHNNMEIITIPLRGAIAHKDSSGGEGVITSGEVQIMSAGTGVYHSEKNDSSTEDINLLQLWIHPKEQNIKPRYDQRKFNLEKNQLTKIVSFRDENSLWINQDAELYLGEFDKDSSVNFETINENSYVYLFLIEGEIEITSKGESLIKDHNSLKLSKRDAIGIIEANEIKINVKENTKLLIIDMDITDAKED